MELAHFLRVRRERLSPSEYSLLEGARRRRTPGLRREELAQLAGMSPVWYTKLEQGQDIQVSTQVLEGIAQVLQLTPQEQTYLHILARGPFPQTPQPPTASISEDVQALLSVLNPHPALVVNERMDVLGWNVAASQTFIDYASLSGWERNTLWMVFTRPPGYTPYDNWEYWAQRALALFRANGAIYDENSWFAERRDRLMQVSSEFRKWWSRHDIADSLVGYKAFHHPRIGILNLRLTMLQVAAHPNLKMFIYIPLDENTTQKLACLVQTAALKPENEVDARIQAANVGVLDCNTLR